MGERKTREDGSVFGSWTQREMQDVLCKMLRQVGVGYLVGQVGTAFTMTSECAVDEVIAILIRARHDINAVMLKQTNASAAVLEQGNKNGHVTNVVERAAVLRQERKGERSL